MSLRRQIKEETANRPCLREQHPHRGKRCAPFTWREFRNETAEPADALQPTPPRKSRWCCYSAGQAPVSRGGGGGTRERRRTVMVASLARHLNRHALFLRMVRRIDRFVWAPRRSAGEVESCQRTEVYNATTWRTNKIRNTGGRDFTEITSHRNPPDLQRGF